MKKQPTKSEFTVSAEKVVHTPTNATWMFKGSAVSSYRASRLGSKLNNGVDYDEDATKKMALKLHAAQ